jgi:hypothetical protein
MVKVAILSEILLSQPKANALKVEQFQQKIVIPPCHISFSLYAYFAVVFLIRLRHILFINA